MADAMDAMHTKMMEFIASRMSAADIECMMRAMDANPKVRKEFEDQFRRGVPFPEGPNRVAFPNADRTAMPKIWKVTMAGSPMLVGAPDNERR